MRKISDTIARLAALKAFHTGQSARRARPGPRLSLLSGFGSNPGGLEARYHRSDHLPEGCPLVVVLHGCTQDASAYDYHSGWSKLADEAGFALLYPEQQRHNNPNLCFNWFLPGDTRRHSGEVLSIRQMIDAMVKTHGLDGERVFITGLSAGGAMAAALLATHPEVFAGGAIIAGLPHGSATSVPEAFDRMRGHQLPSERELQQKLRAASDHQGPWPRISIWHGNADRTVDPANAELIAAQWRAVHELDTAATYSKAIGGILARQVWCDAAGDAVIEINTIAGMGHGIPLASDLGSPGPFMFDVGVSSTREIAAFWGIAKPENERNHVQVASSLTEQWPLLAGHGKPLSQDPSESASPQQATPSISGIQTTIENALRAAGLMR